MPGLVSKHHTHGGSRTAAAVVGGAAAQTQNQMGCPMLHGMAQELAHAIGGGFRGVQPLPYHGQTRSRSHFHHRSITNSAIAGFYRFLPRTSDGNCNLFPTHGFQKTVHGSLSAIGHRKTNNLTIGIELSKDVPSHADNGAAAEGAFKGIGNHNHLFHRLN